MTVLEVIIFIKGGPLEMVVCRQPSEHLVIQLELELCKDLVNMIGLPGDVDGPVLACLVARLCLHLRAGRDLPDISRLEGTERICFKIFYSKKLKYFYLDVSGKSLD